MVATFTQARYIDIAGENGAAMTRKWVQLRQLTDKVDIIPLLNYDAADRQRMTTFLLGLMNIVAPVLGPNAVKAMLTLAMEKGGIEQHDILKIEGADGSVTNVQQEIEAMLQDPDVHPVVKMDDPHLICIQMANMAMAKDMMRYQQTGQQPPDRQNMLEYIEMHKGMLQQQQIMMQMQQIQQGVAQGGPKGKPVQARPDGGPGDEIGGARQNGQAVGQGNAGPMSAAGLTGQNSPMAGMPQ